MSSPVVYAPCNEISNINEKSIIFTKGLINGNFDLDFLTHVQNFFTVSHVNTAILEKVSEFLKIQTSYLYVDHVEKINEIRSITFGEILMSMNDEDPHTINGCSCGYHRESLLTHSLMSMLKTFECISHDMPERYMLHISILALFHDIGKIRCIEIFPKKARIGFPFHGEHGAGIMLQLFVKNSFFSYTEWENMCRAISVHMCGYHSDDYSKPSTIYKMNLLSMERSRVLYMLNHLMYGDSLGKIPDQELDTETPEIILSRREKFIEHTQKRFNIIDFFLDNKLNGILIKLCGQSGSGKSTYAKFLIGEFAKHNIPMHKIVWIERDIVMCNVTSKDIDPTSELITERPPAPLYVKLYEHYQKNKLGSRVNETISNMIRNNCHKIVIFDSVANYYNVDSMLPSVTGNMFRININIIRMEPIDKKTCMRMAMDISQQLKLFGNRTCTSWLPDGVNMHSIASCSTNKEMRDREKIQPHMTYQVAWNKIGTRGSNFVLEMIQLLATQMLSNPDISQMLRMLGNSKKVNDYLLSSRHIVQTPSCNSNLLLIKYLDHNKQFDKKWMRQVRGSAFLMIKNSDDSIKSITCIKQLLMRGIEYLTSYHNEAGILENESSFGMYDDVQIDVMRKLENNSPINSVLTFKSDGSLFGMTIIPKNTEIYTLYMESHLENNAILCLMISLCNDLPFLAIPCSQNMFVFGETMMDYYTMAICTSYEIDVIGMSIIDAFTLGMTRLLESIVRFTKQTNIMHWVDENLIKCLSFEAVCKDRKSIWGSCHTELAVKYDQSSLLFLGCTFNIGNTPGRYVPHFALDKIPNSCDFKEPMWWPVNNRNTIESMLNDVENVAIDKLSKQDFFTKYPCKNLCPNYSSIMDFEGFVMMTLINDVDYDYGKIKTRIYYKCHKVRKENIPYLLDLPTITESYFPTITAIKKFYTDLEPKCQAFTLTVQKLIEDCLDKTHELYMQQNCLSKMMQTFDTKPIETQKRIIIRTFIGADVFFCKIFQEVFEVEICDDIKSISLDMAFDVIINNALIYDNEKMTDRLFSIMNKQI